MPGEYKCKRYIPTKNILFKKKKKERKKRKTDLFNEIDLFLQCFQGKCEANL